MSLLKELQNYIISDLIKIIHSYVTILKDYDTIDSINVYEEWKKITNNNDNRIKIWLC